MVPEFPTVFDATPEDAGQRLDQFLVARLDGISRARVQQMLAEGNVLVNGAAAKPSLRLRGNERVTLLAPAQAPPLRAMAEDIPLDVVYEDDDLAVVNKPAGMMVHAGAGATDDARNRGTLVNALLHRFGALSGVGGQARPGIVHRLDRETSGLILIAKNDVAHRRLTAAFSDREVKKQYVALVHGWPGSGSGTISARISRDRIRRTRMTTRRSGGREALTHYRVRERLDTAFGRFALLDLQIDTGRTHQIRVHLASLGHPVVGDTLYGAPRQLRSARLPKAKVPTEPGPALARNFLHAASIEFTHPNSGKRVKFERALPPELVDFLRNLHVGSGGEKSRPPGATGR